MSHVNKDCTTFCNKIHLKQAVESVTFGLARVGIMTFEAYCHAFRLKDDSFIITTHSTQGESRLCEICNVEVEAHPHLHSPSPHLNDQTHRLRVQELRAFQSPACFLGHVNTLIADCFPAMQELTDNDKDKVYIKLFWYMLSNPSKSTEQLEEVKVMVAKLKYRERVALLELAVWKSVCTMHTSKREMEVEEWMDWFRKGWKADKNQVRSSNDIRVIMTSVLTFLDDPKRVVIFTGFTFGGTIKP
jgi:hypothetical protein